MSANRAIESNINAGSVNSKVSAIRKCMDALLCGGTAVSDEDLISLVANTSSKVVERNSSADKSRTAAVMDKIESDR